MACSSCQKKSGVRYEVSFQDGTKQRYDTLTLAQAAGTASGKPYTFRAVPA